MRIIIVHPDLALLLALYQGFAVRGYFVLGFTTPQEALNLIEPSDCLLTSMTFQNWSGMELALRAYAKGWKGDVIFIHQAPKGAEKSKKISDRGNIKKVF